MVSQSFSDVPLVLVADWINIFQKKSPSKSVSFEKKSPRQVFSAQLEAAVLMVPAHVHWGRILSADLRHRGSSAPWDLRQSQLPGVIAQLQDILVGRPLGFF